MCIAIYSPMGTEVPCNEYLKTSFEENSNGAGFAYNTDAGKVRIQKGFMSWDAFNAAFQKANSEMDFKNRGVLIHFRITTHGGTNPECTHPFPLIADAGAMHKLDYTTDYAVIHNGIISLTSGESYRREKMSDTMVFVEKYLTKIASNKDWFENKNNFELIYDLIDSKMAVLNGRGEINSTYGFTKDEDGNYYSNASYLGYRLKSTTYYNSYGGWDQWDDGYGTYDQWGYSYKKDYSAKKVTGDSKRTFTIPKGNEFILTDDGEDWDASMAEALNCVILVADDDTIWLSDKKAVNKWGYVTVSKLEYYSTGVAVGADGKQIRRDDAYTYDTAGKLIEMSLPWLPADEDYPVENDSETVVNLNSNTKSAKKIGRKKKKEGKKHGV